MPRVSNDLPLRFFDSSYGGFQEGGTKNIPAWIIGSQYFWCNCWTMLVVYLIQKRFSPSDQVW